MPKTSKNNTTRENPPAIMSGDYSGKMWELINLIKSDRTRDAVYLLGCRCQELESLLRSALKRIEQLEQQPLVKTDIDK